VLKLVRNTYKNIPIDEKIKLYLRFCDYLTKEQIEYERQPKESGKTKQGRQETNEDNEPLSEYFYRGKN